MTPKKKKQLQIACQNDRNGIADDIGKQWAIQHASIQTFDNAPPPVFVKFIITLFYGFISRQIAKK